MTATPRVVTIAATDWPQWRDRLPPRNQRSAFWSVEWLEAWGQSFLPYQEWSGPISGAAVLSSDEVLGILPLARQRAGPLIVRSLAGPYAPYRTIPVGEDPAGQRAFADSLAAWLQMQPPSAALRLGPVLASDPGVVALVDALLDAGWRGLGSISGPALTLDLPDTADTLLRSASPSLLKNIRYLRRRLERDAGTPRLQRRVLHANPAELLRTAGAVEARSWVAREGGETKFGKAAYVDFWTRLGRSQMRGAEVVIWLLEVGDAAVAFSAHVETAKTVHVIANGYDESWKAYSPGSLLSEAVLTDACRRGRCWLNWGQGDSGYKTRWGARDADRLLDMLLFHPGALGRSLFQLARWRLPNWQPMRPGAWAHGMNA